MKWGADGRGFIRKTHCGKSKKISPYRSGAVAVAASVFLLYLLAMAAIGSPAMAQGNSAQVLHNEDVVQMVQAKFSDTLIIAKIKSSGCKFDTSTGQLIKLKSEGVSDEVLKAMAECGAPAASPAATTAPPADPNNPDSPHAPGIYLLEQGSAGRQMITLEPTASSGEKTGGMFKMAMSYGLAKANYKMAIPGHQATIRVQEPRPTFYFYFATAAGAMGQGPTNPSDFSLVKLDQKKDRREVIVGRAGITGISSGVSSKDAAAFDAESVRPGVYKVVPKDDLKPGEYAFFFATSAQTMGLTGGKLFAFGIDRGK
ncbi:MAG TPA: hypothetical protein VNM47_04155 [Terriglobia bacterium]|nr:hypothetical protein [Terriglobia bacterium]